MTSDFVAARPTVGVACATLCYLPATAIRHVTGGPLAGIVDPVSVLPALLAGGLGPVALVGLPFGVVLAHALVGGISPPTLVVAASHLAVGWVVVANMSTGANHTRGSEWGRYAAVVIAAASCGTATLAWGNEIVQLAPFYVTVLVELPSLLVSTAVAVAILTVTGCNARSMERSPEGTALLGVGWLAAGTIGSVGYRTLSTLSPETFHSRGVGTLLAIKRPELFGVGAARIQILVGAVALGLLYIRGGVKWVGRG